VLRPRRGYLGVVALVVAVSAAAPSSAFASPNPHDHGFVATAAKGSRHALATESRLSASSDGFSCPSCGSPPLVYDSVNRGPVVPSSTVYAIFWDPSAAPIHFAAAYKDLIVRYFTDLAASSGHPTNSNEVSQQYTDSAGQRASYAVTFGGAFADGDPYPANECTAPNGDPVCISDDAPYNRIQNEVTSFVNAHGLPIDLTHIYFIFTPTGVTTCDGPYSGPGRSCSYSDYCAYHRFTDATTVPLYANIPNDGVSACSDGSLQRPNGSDADITLSSVAHEHNETLTDPQGYGWYDSGGYEIGDECAYTFGTELGGANSAQYNSAINGNHYQLQQEYSNAHGGCVGSIPLTASIRGAPTTPVSARQAIPFDGSSSTEAGSGSISSYSWDFGDGSAAVSSANATTSHTYSAGGTYTVKLTVTDSNGFSDYKTASVTISSDESPSAAFSLTTAAPLQGRPVSLDGTASSDPDGSIVAYRWNFGDGSAPGTGATPSHTYARAGTFTVTLTVTDSSGAAATGAQRVAIDELPSARLVVRVARPASGLPVRFDASSSSDPDGSVRSYRWNFGDRSRPEGGVSPTHSYRKAGTYEVTLTITDSAGRTGRNVVRLQVALAGRVTRVSTQTSRRSKFLLVQVSTPGTLKIGSRRYRVAKAGNVRFKITTTAAESRVLREHHSLRLRVKIEFVPQAGSPASSIATVTLRG
jgi:PKD repeat protein